MSHTSYTSFCSTSLPLTITRWVRSTIKPCTVHSHSKQCKLSINLCNIELNFPFPREFPWKTERSSFVGKKLLGTQRIEPSTAGWEARTLSLRYADPTSPLPLLTLLCISELYDQAVQPKTGLLTILIRKNSFNQTNMLVAFTKKVSDLHFPSGFFHRVVKRWRVGVGVGIDFRRSKKLDFRSENDFGIGVRRTWGEFYEALRLFVITILVKKFLTSSVKYLNF